MRIKNKVSKILRDKSGMAMMFVLGIMLMLMAIGASAITAASANTGFWLKQRDHSRVMILDKAVHENIMHSLQHDPSDKDLLSYKLVMDIYRAYDSGSSLDEIMLLGSSAGPPTGDIFLRFDDDDDGDDGDDDGKIHLNSEDQIGSIRVESVQLLFLVEDVYPYLVDLGPSPEDPEGDSATLKMADVGADMHVIVRINARGRIISSRAVYEYRDGRLIDKSEDPEEEDMQFADDGFGKWRLIKHENIAATDP
jgi:hypothetical protein